MSFLSPAYVMNDLALRVARRHAAADAEGDAAPQDDLGIVTRADLHRLLGYAGVEVDGGSVGFDENAYAEAEVRFHGTRSDGRKIHGVLLVRLEARDDGADLGLSVEIGPIW